MTRQGKHIGEKKWDAILRGAGKGKKSILHKSLKFRLGAMMQNINDEFLACVSQLARDILGAIVVRSPVREGRRDETLARTYREGKRKCEPTKLEEQQRLPKRQRTTAGEEPGDD